EGFDRENALGVPLAAPERNYKDPHPKPEIIVAVSDRFEALCGFRPVADTVALLRALGIDDLAVRLERQPLADVFQWLITRGDGVAPLTARVASLALPKTQEIPAENALPGTKVPQNGQDSFVLGDAVAGALAPVRRLP